MNNKQEKHFKRIDFIFSDKSNKCGTANETESTLNSNFFSDITFTEFSSCGLKKISSTAFGPSTVRDLFDCSACDILHHPPEYHVWKGFSQLTQLKVFEPGLNLDEVPTDAIVPFDGSKSQLTKLVILNRSRNLTVRSGAFQNMVDIPLLKFDEVRITKFEKDAYKLNLTKDSNKQLHILIINSDLFGDSFQVGMFDKSIIKRPILLEFYNVKIDFIPESVFKPVLFNKQNQFSIEMHVDCNDCKNFWLIGNFSNNHSKFNLMCNSNKKLFDSDIQSKLRAKCHK